MVRCVCVLMEGCFQLRKVNWMVKCRIKCVQLTFFYREWIQECVNVTYIISTKCTCVPNVMPVLSQGWPEQKKWILLRCIAINNTLAAEFIIKEWCCVPYSVVLYVARTLHEILNHVCLSSWHGRRRCTQDINRALVLEIAWLKKYPTKNTSI